MGAMASQITSLTIVYSTVYLDADQRKHHSSASLAFVRGIHRKSVNSPHKWPVSRKMSPFDDAIMKNGDIRSTHVVWPTGKCAYFWAWIYCTYMIHKCACPMQLNYPQTNMVCLHIIPRANDIKMHLSMVFLMFVLHDSGLYILRCRIPSVKVNLCLPPYFSSHLCKTYVLTQYQKRIYSLSY